MVEIPWRISDLTGPLSPERIHQLDMSEAELDRIISDMIESTKSSIAAGKTTHSERIVGVAVGLASQRTIDHKTAIALLAIAIVKAAENKLLAQGYGCSPKWPTVNTGPEQIDHFAVALMQHGPAKRPETSRDEIGAGDECKTQQTTKPLTHWLPAGHPLIGHRAVATYEAHPSGILDITLRFKTAEDWTTLPRGYRLILMAWVAARADESDPGLLTSATLCIDPRNRTCYIREVTMIDAPLKIAPVHPAEILLTDFIPSGDTTSLREFIDSVPAYHYPEWDRFFARQYPVTATIAKALSAYTGTSGIYWINLQHLYDRENAKP